MQGSSKSRISIFFVLAALTLPLLSAVGCGDDDQPASDDASPSGVTSTTSGTTGSTNTGESGETGESAPADDDGGVAPGGSDGGAGTDDQGGAGDEEAARTPVEITTAGNGFSEKTPNEVHVPAFIAIELDVTVAGSAPKRLVITRPGGQHLTHVFPAGRRSSYTAEGLRPGRSMIVALGDDRIEVVADAEPGP